MLEEHFPVEGADKHLSYQVLIARMIAAVADGLKGDLLGQEDREKGAHVAKYMKTSSLRFLGIQIPQIRKTARRHIREVPVEMLPQIIELLWKDEVFDFRLAAIEIMEKYSAKGDKSVALQMISDMIDDIDTWALTDPLCIVCLGTLLIRDWSIEETIASWRESENFWRRRATVLPYQHLSKKGFHRSEYTDRILRALNPHLSDKEFFVGKAVGWVLRELSKREPEMVRGYIEENRAVMTKLAIKEGSKKL
ncbi:MAG: DNA alkylation repair protein [Candidatus Thorarchaeota archaeon]|nr:MAG: DNA alkylation repair protein [Candidatus Thorarchaeota archaeon]